MPAKNILNSFREYIQSRSLLPILIWGVFGLLVSLFLKITVGFELKWTIFLILALIIFLFSLTLKESKRFYLALLVLSLPWQLNVRLLYTKPLYYREFNGLVISVMDIPLAILFLYWLFTLLSDRQRTENLYSTFTLPMLGILFLGVLSAIQSFYPKYSFFMLFIFAKNILLFLYLANNIEDERDLDIIISCLLIGIIFQSMIGFAQKSAGGLLGLDILGERTASIVEARAGTGLISRVGGTMGHPNRLAMYLNLWLPLALLLLRSSFSKRYKLFVLVVLLLGFSTEIMTMSRAGWVALAVSSTIVTLIFNHHNIKEKEDFHLERTFHRPKTIMETYLIPGLVMVLIFAVVLFSSPTMKSRIFEHDYGAAATRVPMMRVALNIIKNNLLLGLGPNNYAALMFPYDQTSYAISFKFPLPVHNAFLLLAAEMGIPALILFLIFLVNIFRTGLQFPKDLLTNKKYFIIRLGLIGGILTWVFHSQVNLSYIISDSSLWFLTGLIIGITKLENEIS